METILPARLRHILVRTDPSSLERFRRQLFVFVRHEVAAEGEIVDRGAFAAEVEDPDLRRGLVLRGRGGEGGGADLGVGDATVVAGFGVGFVFAVPITPRRSTTHLVFF
jgi:hypothetical protein